MNVHDLTWSRGEKTVARAAFDAALTREMASIRAELEAMLRRSTDAFDVWKVHDFLSRKRREIDDKYDYRYSVLIRVFARLLREGWNGRGAGWALRGQAAADPRDRRALTRPARVCRRSHRWRGPAASDIVTATRRGTTAHGEAGTC